MWPELRSSLEACLIPSHTFSDLFILFSHRSVTMEEKVHHREAWTVIPGEHLKPWRYWSDIQEAANMLKPSGLKIPGRAGKHSSPVGRASGTTAAAVTTGSKEGKDSIQLGMSWPRLWPALKAKAQWWQCSIGCEIPCFVRFWAWIKSMACLSHLICKMGKL